jgi:hypothetical protein
MERARMGDVNMIGDVAGGGERMPRLTSPAPSGATGEERRLAMLPRSAVGGVGSEGGVTARGLGHE